MEETLLLTKQASDQFGRRFSGIPSLPAAASPKRRSSLQNSPRGSPQKCVSSPSKPRRSQASRPIGDNPVKVNNNNKISFFLKCNFHLVIDQRKRRSRGGGNLALLTFL